MPISLRKSHLRPTFLAIALLGLCSACTDDTSLQQKISENSRLQGTISDLNLTNDDLNRKLNRAKSESRRLKAEKSDLAKKSEKTEKELRELTQEKENLQTEINSLRSTVSNLKQEVTSSQSEVDRVKSTLDAEITGLQQKLSSKELEISTLEGKLSMTIMNSLLFGLGSAELSPEGRQVLEEIGNVLNKEEDKMIRVEGHTDNTPITPDPSNPNYSNWELSAARAINVIHFLEKSVGIPGERMVAVGYGPYHPRAANDNQEERAQNRRIEIVLTEAAKQ